MKKRVISFLLSISMLVAAVPVTTIGSAAADSHTAALSSPQYLAIPIKPRIKQGTATSISITAPRANKKPLLTLPSNTQYTGKITWKAADGSVPVTFAKDAVYTATVTLTAKSGYSFAGLKASSFKVNGTSVTSKETGTKTGITFTFTFPPAKEITMDTDLKVLPPVAGREGCNIYGYDNLKYSFGLTFKDAKGHVLSENEVFKTSTAYTAVLELFAVDGTSFLGIKATDFTVNGKPVTKPEKVTERGMIIEYTFPKTAAKNAAIKTVSGNDLHLRFDLPEAGKRAPFEPISEAFKCKITYRDKDGVLTVYPAAFKANTVYTATMSLTARPQYTFKGVKANTFTVNGVKVKSDAVGTKDTLTFSFTCPKTASTIKYKPITGQNFSINPPVVGGTANNDLEYFWGRNYSVKSFAWKDANGYRIASPAVFKANTKYTVTIVLKAQHDYKFTSNSFTINGKAVTPKLTDDDTVATIKKTFTTGATNAPTKVTETNLEIGDLIVGEYAPYYENNQLIAELCLTNRNGYIYENTPTNTKTPYTVKVKLTTKPGYTLKGVKASDFIINGKAITAKTIGTDNEIIISYEATAKANTELNYKDTGLVPVKERNINVKVPVAGKKIFIDFRSEDEFTYECCYKNDVRESSYMENMSYEVRYILIANVGYTFEGVDPKEFRINNTIIPTAAKTEYGGITLTYTFTTGNIVTKKVTCTGLAIAPPVTGERMYREISTKNNDNDCFSYSQITWTDSSGKELDPADEFVARKAYTMTTKLTAYPAYTFTGMNSKDFTINGYGVTKLKQPVNGGRSITITYTFPKTEDEVLEQLEDTNIDFYENCLGDNINNVILSSGFLKLSKPTWTKNATKLTVTDNTVFEKNCTYAVTFNASIDGYRKEDFTLKGLNAKDFTVNGYSSDNIALKENTDGSVNITYTFSPVPKSNLKNTIVDTALEILPPVAGRYISGDLDREYHYYVASVSWTEKGDDVTFSTAKPGKVYTATVTLTAEPDYVFSSTNISDFVVNGKPAVGKIEADGKTATFKYTFPATGAVAPLDMVTAVNFRIHPPIAGKEIPELSSWQPYDALPEINNKSRWNVNGAPVEGGKFLANTAYTLVTTLTPYGGYTFKGVPMDSFTLNGKPLKAKYNKTDDTVTVTYTFPKTLD